MADTFASASFADGTKYADELDQTLSLRTYLVSSGHTLTAADVAIWAGMRASTTMLGINKKNVHIHLSRWFDHIDNLASFKGAVETLNAEKSNKARASKQAASFDLFLGDEAKKGQVVTRFPPEPSGYLHVGHAKAAILNQYFARRYEGKLIIRFDDTNPNKEKEEFEDSIIQDLELMGIKGDSTSHTSDYFDELYKLAIQLIKQGDAYADDTLQEEMRAQRMDGIASKRRDSSVEDTMARFAEMSTGSDEGRKWCLRAKMSVDNPNKAMRDPVIYRVNADTPHHRAGTTWKVYPTYDFACPVVDSLEGVTHALRTNEYRDRNPQYAWMLEKLGLRNVNIWDFGRLNFVYTLLSKRKLQWFVDRGFVSGWDDPRFPTVRGIRRRGMTIDCIQQFILATGPSQQVINMEWDSIWTLNKRLLDPVVPRYTALDEKDVVKCTLSGAGVPSQPEDRPVPRHKKNPELGDKVVTFAKDVLLEQVDAKTFVEGEIITLMDWGNVKVGAITKSGDKVESIALEADFENKDFKKTKKTTWLSPSEARSPVSVTLIDYDYLITKPKLEEDDKVENFLTPETEFKTVALVDSSVLQLEAGQAIQFERKGYFIVDQVAKSSSGGGEKMVLVRIPDGKVETTKSKGAGAEGSSTVADDANARKAAAAEERAKKKKAKEEKEAEKLKKKAEKNEKKAATAAGVAGGAGAAVGAAAAATATAVVDTSSKAAADAAGTVKSMYKMRPLTDDIETNQGTSKMYSMKKFDQI